jgi:hypothetical protein
MKGEPGQLKKERMAGEQKEWAMAGRKTAWRRRVWLRKRDGEGAEGRGGARNDGTQVRVAGGVDAGRAGPKCTIRYVLYTSQCEPIQPDTA